MLLDILLNSKVFYMTKVYAWLIALFLCMSQSLPAATYKLALCAIFQNDAPFLQEWIEFHKLQGVEHFYLYNNRSQDEFKEVLAPYVESGEVTLVEWPFTYPENDHSQWIRIQSSAYMDCV